MKNIILAASALLSLSSLQAYNIGNGFSVDAEALYWSLSDSFPSALSVERTEVDGPTTPFIFEKTIVQANVKTARENWEPGVRVGLGWSGCDCLDIQAFYTWYYNENQYHELTSFNFMLEGFQRLFASGEGTLFPEKVRRTFNYNVADLEFGRAFNFCSFTFRPYAGIRAAWIDGKNHVTINGLSETFTSPPVEVQEPLSISFNDKLWSVGPRFGFDSSWGNFGGVSVLANLSLSALYGRHTHVIRVTVIDAFSDGQEVTEQTTDVTIDNRYYRVTPCLQTFIGLGWATCFGSNYNLRIKAGWESNYWWDLGHVIVLDRALTLQGLTAGLEFSF